MDKLIPKALWLFAGACLFITFANAQNVRPLPVSSRRRLPTVIITREHLRQRQNSYGAHGDTAAEFVVSAGLDTSKNTAVRIRRIGNRRLNATHTNRSNFNTRFNFRNDSISRGTVIRPHPQYRTPSFQNAYERNGISDTAINRRYHLNEGNENRQVIDRRQHLGEKEQLIPSPNGGFYRSPNRNPPIPERHIYQYRPPIFVPNYQHNRRADVNVGVPGEANLRPSNNIDTNKRRVSVTSHDQVYPVVSVKYSTSSVSSSVSQKQHPQRPISRPNNVDSSSRKPLLSSRNNNKQNDRLALRGNNQRLPFLSQNSTRNYQKEKPSVFLNSSDHFHTSTNNPSGFASKQDSEKSDINVKNGNSKSTSSSQNTTFAVNNDKVDNPSKKENAYNKIKDEELKDKPANTTREVVPRNPVVESANPDQNVLAETPSSQSNSEKIRQFQTRLIRKPSLILRDQITVNELPRKSDRTRYGPRSLENIDEVPLSRRKRQVETNEHQEHAHLDNNRENMTSSNVTVTNEFFSNTSQRRGKYDRRHFQIQNSPNESFKMKHMQQSINGSSENSKTTLVDEEESRISLQYHPGEQFSDGTYYDDSEKSPESDIMAFSDFISSPLSEKIRLDRQLFLRNKTGTEGNSSIHNTHINGGNFDSRSLKNSTMTYLRNLITARLLHILNLSNLSSNYSKHLKSGRYPEEVNSAEQRNIGIMVSPYESQDSYDSRSHSPVVRILKGKIVSLPDIPPELIPIILGTYKPTYTEPEEPKEPTYNDDPKLTENIIDNAILKLLQNDDLLNLQPGVVRKVRPIAYKVNRKSPSTNYVGSLKTNEPMGRLNYGFKPNEWSLEPRCDRLTEEICLDDSDYPSSAIMSSIYKDKNKFDSMYAEVKVHESQVEGLSRQQEIAYSFDHYYGAYPQASGSNLIARDYGPNGGFVCPSEVHYARPHRAKNRKGEWKVVVNVGEYTQTLRMEKCLSSGNPCKYVVNHMQSTCSQVYSYHRLLVFSKENGLHIDVFRVPTSCTCHLRPGQKSYNPKHAASSPYLVRPGPFDEYAGHVETAPNPQHLTEKSSLNHEKKKNSFSNTLWAILGGGPQAGALAQQPQFLDEVQKQIMWTQQLKQYPHLMKQISPNQVLKQLLEEDEEDYSIRRQRIRQKHPLEKLTSGGFSSHQAPMVVPLPPPPPPPPNAMLRRPIVNIAPMNHKHLFSVPHEQSKIFALSSPSEQTKVFSLTKDSKFGKSPIRANYDAGYGNIYTIVGPQTFSKFSAYKVHPGMYPPKSENVQIPESSLLPVAPQFSSHPDNRLKPIMKPMPAPHGSNKNIVEDEDLIAAEKSVGEDIQSFAVETETDSRVVPHDDNESKINFSYHPILEYLNV